MAVYSESDFVNNSNNFWEQELALPSTGHDENGPEPGGRISNGILSIQLWVQGERVRPEFIQDGNEEWYTIKTRFTPHENRVVKALFWAETSLTDIDSLPGLDTTIIANGKRGFLINLAHASVWNSTIDSLETYVILKDGLSQDQQIFSVEPPPFNINDSTLAWTNEYLEPSESDNINIFYESSSNSNPGTNTMAKLSRFIIKKVYDELLDYAYHLDEL